MYPRKIKRHVQRNGCSWMFTAAFLMITKRVNNPDVQQMKNGDTKCGWYIHSMEYYLARRRNEVLICHTVDKNRMPRERSQSQKTTHCMIPFIWSIQNKQMHRESTVATASGDQSPSDSWKVQAFFWRWWKCPKNLFWLWLHNSANRLKAITSYTWNGWFVWLVNYVSIMPLPKLIIN